MTGPWMLPWAAALIAAGGPGVPEYGSPDWHALPSQDRRKVAACVLAAECWRSYTDPAEIGWRLRAEIEYQDDEPAVWTPETVAQVHRTARQPSFAELCDRRGESERAERARLHERRMDLLLPRDCATDGST